MSIESIIAENLLKELSSKSASQHKSISRKFGNKYQKAKRFFKRDKKHVAADIATKTLNVAVKAIPIPGCGEGASLLAKAGLSAAKSAACELLVQGSKKGVGYLMANKLEKLKKARADALQAIPGGTVNVEELAKMERKQLLEIETAVRKSAKYQIMTLPKITNVMGLRMFKLKEASNSCGITLSKMASELSSTKSTPLQSLGAFNSFYGAVIEVEHYQDKLRTSLVEAQLIIDEVESYLAVSEAATSVIKSTNRNKFEAVIKKVCDEHKVNNLEGVKRAFLHESLRESGLMV